MKRLVRGVACGFVCFFVAPLIAHGGQHMITVLYPPDMTVMAFNRVGISLNLPQQAVDSIEIRVNGKKSVDIIPRRRVECFSVPLETGINRIDITARKGTMILDRVSLSVFQRSDLVSKYAKPPPGFQKDYFHIRDRPVCSGCHHRL